MHTLTIFNHKQKYRVTFHGTPTVKQVLEENKISMPHPCGGAGRCGKCAIEIIGTISAPDEKERDAGCRLSCRTRLYGDAVVTLCADTDLLAESSTEPIMPSANPSKKLGAAVDIGTTTVALSIYDLTTGSCLATKTMLNPQSVVSADVMGRIEAATNQRLSDLQSMIVSCIHTLAETSGYIEQIDKWCITGNTTMLYLLSGKNPQSFATAPYIAEHLFGEEISFLEKTAYLPDCIHAFAGADLTCAVFASGMCHKTETALLCDIGTNGEIALWKSGKLYTTSTAAGPVFEGAGISCGCQSIGGAIEHVTLQNHMLFIKTIDNKKAVGLCGSGVIDTVACLLDSGIADETGAMTEEKILLNETVFFTQEDIRNVQLAKAAIAAGIRTLLEATGTSEEEISTFYIAGGFGTHLNPDSAVRIGLFPAAFKNKINILGNAALTGAARLLTDEEAKKQVHTIACAADYLNLGGNPEFNKNYMEEMYFHK